MVNRMPGSSIYKGRAGTAAAVVRPRNLPSVNGKGESQSTHATASTNTGIENNNSTRSSRSTATTGSEGGSARKMRRGNFRRTLLMQRNRRNSGSWSNHQKEIKASSTAGDASSSSHQRLGGRLQGSSAGSSSGSYHERSSLPLPRRGADSSPAMEEEREAGACSPTFPPATTTAADVANHNSTLAAADANANANTMDGDGGPQTLQELPRGHVQTILDMYRTGSSNGGVLDLYKDVLKVSPAASDREIRIAYFRRGREILGDTASSKYEDKTQNQKAVSNLDPATKSRFQAVSMAYEILSTPAWKEAYRKQGGLRELPSALIQPAVPALAAGDAPGIILSSSKVSTPKRSKQQEPFDPFVSSPLGMRGTVFPDSANINVEEPIASSTMFPKTSTLNPVLPASASSGKPQHLPTALRKSSFVGNGNGGGSHFSRRRRRGLRKPSGASVRWKDHVEELVFVKHPNENASDDDDDDDDDDSDYHNSSDEEDSREDNRPVVFSDPGPSEDLYSDPSVSGRGSNTTRDNSISHSSRGSGSASNRRRKKNKAKIVIDSEELESHLKRMDSEAEKHFVQDFWDNFEESMDGLLSLVDSMGGGGGDPSSKTNKKKNKSSSWLMSSLSSGNKESQRKDNRINQDAVNPDASIGRSMSHDATITSNDDEFKDDGNGIKRSNSLPTSLSSIASIRSNAVSSPSSPMQQQPPTAGIIVTPDEKDAARESSPYDMILNSWPFQSSNKSEDKAKTEKKSQPQHSAATPAIVSPEAKSASVTPVVVSPGSDLDATASVASTILSTSQRRQKSLFRPISPTVSEASEAINSDFVSPPSPSADAFELDSRLSEMDSVDLTQLDNPFRRGKGDASPAPSLSTPSESSSIQKSPSDESMNSTPSKSSKKKKKSRFRVSMLSRIRGSSPTEKEISPPADVAKIEKNTASSSGTTARNKQCNEDEDVFAGVEDLSSKHQREVDAAETKNEPNSLQVENISMKRSCSASQLSDLSESVYKASDDDAEEAAVVEKNLLSVTFSPSLGSRSVVSESTKKSLVNSTAGRSEGSTAGYSSFDGATSATSLDFESTGATGMETSGFFDYFLAYVSAVMTECANLGAATGAAEYQQDFMNLFVGDASVQTAEIREQPSTLRRVPSESTSSHTF